MSTTKGVRKYVAFHQQVPKRVTVSNLVIPDTCVLAGPAVNVLYRSDKLNPTTSEDEGWIDYIHEHSAGVNVYLCGALARDLPGPERAVPAWIRDTQELTWLGDNLGFEWRVKGDRNGLAKARHPLPELLCTPSGKALLVVQGKRTVLAIIYGGKLGVEPRGIVH